MEYEPYRPTGKWSKNEKTPKRPMRESCVKMPHCAPPPGPGGGFAAALVAPEGSDPPCRSRTMTADELNRGC